MHQPRHNTQHMLPTTHTHTTHNTQRKTNGQQVRTATRELAVIKHRQRQSLAAHHSQPAKNASKHGKRRQEPCRLDHAAGQFRKAPHLRRG
jgi:hypothetical protein